MHVTSNSVINNAAGLGAVILAGAHNPSLLLYVTAAHKNSRAVNDKNISTRDAFCSIISEARYGIYSRQSILRFPLARARSEIVYKDDLLGLQGKFGSISWPFFEGI